MTFMKVCLKVWFSISFRNSTACWKESLAPIKEFHVPKASAGLHYMMETKFKHYIIRTICHILTYPEASLAFLAASKSFLFQINLYSFLIRVNFSFTCTDSWRFSNVIVSAADTKFLCYMNRAYLFISIKEVVREGVVFWFCGWVLKFFP